VLAQVLGKVRYAPREHRDLHLGRPCIGRVRPVLLYYLFFVLDCRQLPLSPLLLALSLCLCLFNAICYHMHQIVSFVIRRASSTSRAICSLSSATPENLFSGRILRRKFTSPTHP
jgi:hypothetical protein